LKRKTIEKYLQFLEDKLPELLLHTTSLMIVVEILGKEKISTE
jgi:hypothetical protein